LGLSGIIDLVGVAASDYTLPSAVFSGTHSFNRDDVVCSDRIDTTAESGPEAELLIDDHV
jgi:hypothetical protein